MSFCTNCGKEIAEGGKFCGFCGTPVVEQSAPVETVAEPVKTPVVTQPTVAVVEPVEEVVNTEPVYSEPQPTYTQPEHNEPKNEYGQERNFEPRGTYVSEDALIAEEQEFLDTTYRILRWEHKAWSILGKAYVIIGAVLAGIFLTIGFLGMASGEGEMIVVGMSYGITYGLSFLAQGIISKKAAEKIPQYQYNFYTNYRMANDRCGSVGMLVFSIFFGQVAFVFFLINFIRIKSNGRVISRILNRLENQ